LVLRRNALIALVGDVFDKKRLGKCPRRARF
jgi:hypothetical protein